MWAGRESANILHLSWAQGAWRPRSRLETRRREAHGVGVSRRLGLRGFLAFFESFRRTKLGILGCVRREGQRGVTQDGRNRAGLGEDAAAPQVDCGLHAGRCLDHRRPWSTDGIEPDAVASGEGLLAAPKARTAIPTVSPATTAAPTAWPLTIER